MHDPFNEHSGRAGRRHLHLLGGIFEFDSNDSRLLRLVDLAYSGLHRNRLTPSVPRFQVRLQLTDGQLFTTVHEPPPMRMQGGAGIIYGGMDAANFAVVSPRTRTGLVAISRDLLLRFPYHARYELLEFAVFTLASRSQGLMPLHAGCVGSSGNGILLVGESGMGKSTLALQCMIHGLDFMAEDAVFVRPQSLLAAGISNFLHLREDALQLIGNPSITKRLHRSPVICRRSGVEKLEVDMRRKGYRLAREALRIVAVAFISKKKARGSEVLVPLGSQDSLRRLRGSQQYAASLPGWTTFERRIVRVGAFELRRADEPGAGAKALRGLLDWGCHEWRTASSVR